MKNIMILLCVVLSLGLTFAASTPTAVYDDQVAAKSHYDDQSKPGHSQGSAGAASDTQLTMDRDSGVSYHYLWNPTTKKYDGHTGTPGQLSVWFHDHPERPHYHYNRIVGGIVVETGYLY